MSSNVRGYQPIGLRELKSMAKPSIYKPNQETSGCPLIALAVTPLEFFGGGHQNFPMNTPTASLNKS